MLKLQHLALIRCPLCLFFSNMHHKKEVYGRARAGYYVLLCKYSKLHNPYQGRTPKFITLLRFGNLPRVAALLKGSAS